MPVSLKQEEFWKITSKVKALQVTGCENGRKYVILNQKYSYRIRLRAKTPFNPRLSITPQ